MLCFLNQKVLTLHDFLLEVKRFTENAVHRGAVSSVRFTIPSFFIFGSVRFIRSFLVPLRQIKKRKKRRKKAIKT